MSEIDTSLKSRHSMVVAPAMVGTAAAVILLVTVLCTDTSTGLGCATPVSLTPTTIESNQHNVTREKKFESVLALLEEARADNVEIKPETLKAACALLDVIPFTIPSPHIAFSDEGEIGLTWLKTQRRRFSVMIDQTETTWLYTNSGEKIAGGDHSATSDASDFAPLLQGLSSFHDNPTSVPV